VRECFQGREQDLLASLVEATGFIATSQRALDYVGPAIAFVHELMASTLVRAYNDEGLTIMTSQLWKDGYNTILRRHPDWQVPEIEEAILNENNLLVDTNSIVRPERMRRFEKDLWLPAYEQSFPGFQFRKTHARLMKAWRKIITSIVEGSWHNVLLALVRYPFDIQLRRLKPFTWESVSIAVDGLCAYLQLEENEPRRRLEAMLRTIERAPAFKHESLWQEYLRASLPGYGTWNSGHARPG